MRVVGSFTAGTTSFVLARIRFAVGMLIDVSQLLGSKVPPSSTIPGVEARGIKYVKFSGSIAPNITHYELRSSGEIKSCSPAVETVMHSLTFGEYTSMV